MLDEAVGVRKRNDWKWNAGSKSKNDMRILETDLGPVLLLAVEKIGKSR